MAELQEIYAQIEMHSRYGQAAKQRGEYNVYNYHNDQLRGLYHRKSLLESQHVVSQEERNA